MTVMSKAALLFLAGLLLILLSWWESTQQLADIIWNVDIYSHGLLVPFVSLWLIWRQEEADLPAPGRPSLTGALLMLPVSLVWLIGDVMEASILQHGATVLAIQALFLAVYGMEAFKRHLFALLFLFFMIPFGGGLVLPLQKLTTAIVTWGLDVVGINHVTEGVLIQLDEGLYEVAEACAGLKFLFTSVVTGVLLCHLTFESWLRRVLMLLASVLVPLLANSVRVFTILLIAEHTDQDFAKSVDHVVYGWVFLSFVLLILIMGAYRFSDRAQGGPLAPAQARGRWLPRLWHAAIAAPALVALWAGLSVHSDATCSLPPVPTPMCTDCEYRALPLSKGQFPIEPNGADAMTTWLFRDGGQRFSVLSAAFLPDRANHRTVQATFGTLREEWQVLAGSGAGEQSVGGITFTELVVWRGHERQLVWRAYVAGGSYAPSGQAAKVKLGLNRLRGAPAHGAVVQLATSMADDLDTARSDLRKFLSTFPPDRFLWKQLLHVGGDAVCAE